MKSAAASSTLNQRLASKVSMITGGASGIGASTVHLFHENGAKVVIADIQDNLGVALAQKLGENVCYIHCDVSNENEVCNLVDTTIKRYGKLDIMYNNAGIIDRPSGSILDTPKSDLDRVIGVNLVGCFLGAKHAARVMVPQGQGCILFTASACTAIGGLATHAYVVTKYGIMGLAKNLAAELGQYGIRVNCISPFGLATPMLRGYSAQTAPMIEATLSQMGNLKGQIPKPEGIANAALFLASDEANYVSGLNLIVDGGFSVINPTLMNAINLAN